jgi:Reverse transcriptase (RNA-dependent DNA polymerase)
MTQKWANKFERKPGKWVFEPTDEYRSIGEDIKNAVKKAWKAPSYYFHLRDGGHVKALRLHTKNQYFVRFDIEDFFGSINRSRVTRCLKEHFSFEDARRMANDSTVQHPTVKGRWVVPYGFVQSPIVASMALAKSRLGSELQRLHCTRGVMVSVYVDDIVVSCSDLPQLEKIRDVLTTSAERAALAFNPSKSQGPAIAITAFNINLANASLAVSAPRLNEFAVALAETPSLESREGILGYVKSVNAAQADDLAK